MTLTMNFLPTLALLLILVSKSYNLDPVKIRDQRLWQPGVNQHANRLQGGCLNMNQDSDSQRNLPKLQHNLEDLEIPESFDAREHWPNCPSIREISDQAQCGSCWAFGSVEAMTDRICIHSHGKINFHFSADDLVSCCSSCGGCNGSTLDDAYRYWINNGIVSGGAYGSNEGCRPYELHSLFKYFKSYSYGDSETIVPTPKCVKQCERGYPIPYNQDLHFGKEYHGLENDAKQIQAEIMLNGPVTAAFWVYEDFRYKYRGKGIYHYTSGNRLGGHAVKLIGWGVENGIDYWIVANSWGTNYGDNGFFKFIRGENNCGIEQNVVSGIPAYS